MLKVVAVSVLLKYCSTVRILVRAWRLVTVYAVQSFTEQMMQKVRDSLVPRVGFAANTRRGDSTGCGVAP